MGASISSSSQQQQQQQLQPQKDNSNKICIDCDKKTQKDLPQASTAATGDGSESATSAAPGQACAEIYVAVTTCNSQNAGQVSPCVKLWEEFRTCHEANGKRSSSGNQ